MKKYAKYMALAVTLALLGLIFYFSAQPGAVSYKVSETVMNTVQSGKAKAVTPQWFSTTNLNVNCLQMGTCLYLLRAGGQHGGGGASVDGQPCPVAEGAAVCGTVYAVCRRGRAAPVLCPGRAMLLSDVGIDAMGFLPCIAAVFLCIRVYRGCRK